MSGGEAREGVCRGGGGGGDQGECFVVFVSEGGGGVGEGGLIDLDRG